MTMSWTFKFSNAWSTGKGPAGSFVAGFGFAASSCLRVLVVFQHTVIAVARFQVTNYGMVHGSESQIGSFFKSAKKDKKYVFLLFIM